MRFHIIPLFGLALLALSDNSAGQRMGRINIFSIGPTPTTTCGSLGNCQVMVKVETLYANTKGNKFKCEVSIPSPVVIASKQQGTIEWYIDTSEIGSFDGSFSFRLGDGIKFIGKYDDDFKYIAAADDKHFQYISYSKTPSKAFPYEVNIQYNTTGGRKFDCDPVDPLVVNQG